MLTYVLACSATCDPGSTRTSSGMCAPPRTATLPVGEEDADSVAPDDTDIADLDATASWTGHGVTIAITNGKLAAGYDLGLAQTGSYGGWAGEDCLGDVPAGYDYMDDGGYDLCHHLSQTGGSLETVDAAEDVVPGSTTLLSRPVESSITYVLFEATSNRCWSWGDDVWYYDGFLCTWL